MRIADQRINAHLLESINDKYIFKAVFMAGGAGSGKTWVAESMFSGTGARFVNSDSFFEYLLKKANLPFEVEDISTVVGKAQAKQRKRAKELTYKKWDLYLDGMLPLVIDGTGKDYGKITKQADTLKEIGYDVYMVLVNTSLEVSLERNAARKRKVNPSIVQKMWHQVQDNIGKFQGYFGTGMVIIDNNEYLEGQALAKMQKMMGKIAMKMFNEPLKNHIGKRNFAMLQVAKAKYLTDVGIDPTPRGLKIAPPI